MSLGSARGKIILLGEHAVVYGVPALAAGIDRGAIARVEPADSDKILFGTQELTSEHELYEGLRLVREAFHVPPLRLELSLQIPAGSGLGASAALGVATARAVAQLAPNPIADRHLLSIVAQWERVFHGNPSGIDAAAAFHAGVLRYVRGEEPERVRLRAQLTIVITISGPPANTREMVEGVARLREQRPEAFDKTLTSIASLISNATLCLRSGDREGLGKLMDLNQMLLSTWMVSTPEIERACHTARRAGAYGAKLTGSGGGGCTIALTPEDPEPVLRALRAEGFECFACEIGENQS